MAQRTHYATESGNEESNLRSFLGKRLRGTVEELTIPEDADPPNPQSQDTGGGDMASSPISGGSNEGHGRKAPPSDKLREYWRQYKSTDIVQHSIDSYARHVVEPGYRVEHNGILDEEQEKQLNQWLQRCATLEGHQDKDILPMIKKACIQYEVKGTCLIEKVYKDEKKEELADYGALKFLSPESITANTKPNQAILISEKDEESTDGGYPEDTPRTDNDKPAAYVQEKKGIGSSQGEIIASWAVDQVIKVARDADTNEIFGTSRIEPVSNRIEGRTQKMQDNDQAIASKAYPLLLFKFGTDENPWPRERINEFMRAHEMDNFHAGMKQGVRGDVEVVQISGEVADIEPYLENDVNSIMSAMPTAKFQLGSYDATVSQIGYMAQERTVNREIKETRRDFESEFTPFVREYVEQQFGVGEEEIVNIKFKLGRPGEEGDDENPNRNILDYRGKNDNQNTPQQNPNGSVTNPSGDNPEPDTNPEGDGPEGGNNDEDSSESSQSPHKGVQLSQDADPSEEDNIWQNQISGDTEQFEDISELADPRLVSSSSDEKELTGYISQTIMDTRNRIIDILNTEFNNAPNSALMMFSGRASTIVNRQMEDSEVGANTAKVMDTVVRNIINTLNQNNQGADVSATFTNQNRMNVRNFARRTESSVRKVLNQMTTQMERQLENNIDNGMSLDNAVDNLEGAFNNDRIRQRAQLISRMQIQNAIESTKIAEYEASEDVLGVKVINGHTKDRTRLCQQLTNGENAVAYFEDGPLSEQWESYVDQSVIFAGFDPLPDTPPFHWNCRSELVPITERRESLEISEGEYTVKELEEMGINVK